MLPGKSHCKIYQRRRSRRRARTERIRTLFTGGLEGGEWKEIKPKKAKKKKG